MVKNLKFEENIQLTPFKSLDFAKFHVLNALRGQKSEIWAQFSMQFKFLDFAKFHVLQEDQMVKSLKFEHNFQHDSNFLILPNFMFLKDQGGQKA